MFCLLLECICPRQLHILDVHNFNPPLDLLGAATKLRFYFVLTLPNFSFFERLGLRMSLGGVELTIKFSHELLLLYLWALEKRGCFALE